MVRSLLTISLICLILSACRKDNVSPQVIDYGGLIATEKMNGVSFVGAPNPITASAFVPVQNVNANWVTLMPFGIGSGNDPSFNYGTNLWWGETWEGIGHCTQVAHAKGIQVMIKPHLWFWNGTWQGDLSFSTEAEWLQFEANYHDYILSFAHLADSLNADAFCLGVELRQFVAQRPAFWQTLINDVKAVYGGPVTYAANWDDYRQFPYWDQLNYIGIDAYFPLSQSSTPTVNELKTGWEPHKEIIAHYADSLATPVVFTEFGYRSMESNAWEPWTTGNGNAVNLQNQVNCYQAMFETFWPEPWFMGGYSWKWYDDHAASGGSSNNNFTPQNKPVEATMADWYKAWE